MYQQTCGEPAAGRHDQHPQRVTAALTSDRALDEVCGDEPDQPVIAYRDESAGYGNCDGEYKIFLVGWEAKTLEYARGVELNAAPQLD